MFKIGGIVFDIEESLKKKESPGKIKLEIRGKRLLIIADEKVELKKGEITNIKIKNIDIEPYTLTLIDAYEKHPIGSVISIGEEISLPFDSKRRGDYGVFIAFKDGVVNKGDVIGCVVLIHLDLE